MSHLFVYASILLFTYFPLTLCELWLNSFSLWICTYINLYSWKWFVCVKSLPKIKTHRASFQLKAIWMYFVHIKFTSTYRLNHTFTSTKNSKDAYLQWRAKQLFRIKDDFGRCECSNGSVFEICYVFNENRKSTIYINWL